MDSVQRVQCVEPAEDTRAKSEFVTGAVQGKYRCQTHK